MKTITKLWIGLAILIVVSPIGLILPEHFKAGSAWGEWGAEEIHKLVGYIPKGFEKIGSLWNAPIQDYAFKLWGGKGPFHIGATYILSATLGIAITVSIVLFLGRFLSKK